MHPLRRNYVYIVFFLLKELVYMKPGVINILSMYIILKKNEFKLIDIFFLHISQSNSKWTHQLSFYHFFIFIFIQTPHLEIKLLLINLLKNKKLLGSHHLLSVFFINFHFVWISSCIFFSQYNCHTNLNPLYIRRGDIILHSYHK